jgi:hypothetical protein
MDLRQTIEFVRALEKEFVLFNIDPTDPIDDRLSTFFGTQNVTVTTEETASDSPAGIAVLSSEEEVLEATDVETLRTLVDHVESGTGSVGVSDTAYEPILSHLKETTFTSHSTKEMLYASREIEDRARRSGGGTVHAGFQRCTEMNDQRPIYSDLPRRDVSVHAYSVPDVTPPEIAGGQVHAVEAAEIAVCWFVVYDGGRDESQKSALLAEERAEEEFYGVWTYDAAIVDHICDYLERTYLSADDTSQQPGI